MLNKNAANKENVATKGRRLPGTSYQLQDATVDR